MVAAGLIAAAALSSAVTAAGAIQSGGPAGASAPAGVAPDGGRVDNRQSGAAANARPDAEPEAGKHGTASPSGAGQHTDEDGDVSLDRAQPDFTLSALPTTLRVPKYRGAFRVTHRFLRDLTQGSVGDLFGDLFGLDSGAVIGLEARFGVVPGGQVGFHRTSDGKTIEFFGQYQLLRQRGRMPFTLDVFASIEGPDNFTSSRRSPAVGAVLSRTVSDWMAFYAHPIYVGNSNLSPDEPADHDDTLLIGVGGRLRVRPTVYLVAEAAPRAAGYSPGLTHASLAVEKRAGGHLFQLSVSTSHGTTMAQLARGGGEERRWYLGFYISRKFY